MKIQTPATEGAYYLKPDYDSDSSPDDEHNQEVARRLNLRFDASKNAYVDDDGCLIRDHFGQPF